MIHRSLILSTCLLGLCSKISQALIVNGNGYSVATRRTFITSTAVICTLSPAVVHAKYPSVTVAQFQTILQDSASSIQIVEFSGPKSENALVTLTDGTIFQISDLFESSTDPRSPLKLVATCRSYGVKTKFTSLEDIVSQMSQTGGKKRKVYMNKRVQEAFEKEKEKKERMAQDEIERNAQLQQMN